MGDGQHDIKRAPALLGKAKQKYNEFHIQVKQQPKGNRHELIQGWKDVEGDNLIVSEEKEHIAKIISDTIIANTAFQEESFEVSPDQEVFTEKEE